jgi:putative membrane protein
VVQIRETPLPLSGLDEPVVDYSFTLANERTFLSWIRTSLTLFAGGIAATQVLPDHFGPAWARLALGLGLLFFGALAALTGYRRWREIDRAIRANRDLPTTYVPAAIAGGTVALAVIGWIAALW